MIPPEMLRAARKDRFCEGRVVTAMHRVPLLHDGVVVGFYTPHLAADGRARIGPVYVEPEHRNKGIVSALYRTFVVPMMATIEAVNLPSVRLHEKAGFVPWKRWKKGLVWKRDP